MARKPETKFTERVKQTLDKIDGIWYYKTQEVSRRGIPDIIGCLEGKMFALEIKIETETATSLQRITLQEMSKSGAFTAVVKPSTLKESISALIRFCREKPLSPAELLFLPVRDISH